MPAKAKDIVQALKLYPIRLECNGRKMFHSRESWVVVEYDGTAGVDREVELYRGGHQADAVKVLVDGEL